MAGLGHARGMGFAGQGLAGGAPPPHDNGGRRGGRRALRRLPVCCCGPAHLEIVRRGVPIARGTSSPFIRLLRKGRPGVRPARRVCTECIAPGACRAARALVCACKAEMCDRKREVGPGCLQKGCPLGWGCRWPHGAVFQRKWAPRRQAARNAAKWATFGAPPSLCGNSLLQPAELASR